MQRFKVLVPAPVPVPRGAKWAADFAAPVFSALAALGGSRDSILAVAGARSLRALWRVLESQGRRRAIRELRSIADGCESYDPARAQRMRECAAFLAFEDQGGAQPPIATRKQPEDRTREAAEVRAWANQFTRTDPSFAAELYAAADRHETAEV